MVYSIRLLTGSFICILCFVNLSFGVSICFIIIAQHVLEFDFIVEEMTLYKNFKKKNEYQYDRIIFKFI